MGSRSLPLILSQTSQASLAHRPLSAHVDCPSSYAERPPSSSSPINHSGDSRLEVKEFFTWLINQRLPEDQDEYVHTMEVALDEHWTVSDLRAMSDPQGPVYRLARELKLKDGIIRHFREDLRLFKAAYRGAQVMCSVGISYMDNPLDGQ